MPLVITPGSDAAVAQSNTACSSDDFCAATEYCQTEIGLCCPVGYSCNPSVRGSGADGPSPPPATVDAAQGTDSAGGEVAPPTDAPGGEAAPPTDH